MQKNALSLSISLLALGLSTAAPTFAAEQVDSITDAIAGGDASVSARYRYEFVDVDDASREAKASTIKTRISYQTLGYQGFSAKLEVDNNSVAFEDSYNDGTGGVEAVVKDPTYTEINQAYIDFSAPADTLLRYGRQRVLLDNQRFVGGVGWRQNEQTYDAFALVNSSLPDTTLLIANVYNVNTITGGNIDGHEHQLYNISNSSIDGLKLSAYYYDLKKISDTYGLRASGKFATSDELSILYTAEFAQQETDNVAANETDYLSLEAGLDVSGVSAKFGYEVLGSDNGAVGFGTPLGTNHKFNGWADKFLGTPVVGLEDKYLSISSKLLGPKVALVYHQFDADHGDIDFGNEVDLLVAQKFTDNYSGLIKFANFSQGDVAGGKADTTKVWLQLLASF